MSWSARCCSRACRVAGLLNIIFFVFMQCLEVAMDKRMEEAFGVFSSTEHRCQYMHSFRGL